MNQLHYLNLLVEVNNEEHYLRFILGQLSTQLDEKEVNELIDDLISIKQDWEYDNLGAV